MNNAAWKSPVNGIARPCYAFTALHMATSFALIGIHAGYDNSAFGEETKVVHQFTLRGHKDWVSSVAFSPDGKTLASAGPHIKLWNPDTGDELATLETENTSQNFISYAADGDPLFSARGDGEVVWWFFARGKHRPLTWLKNPTGATNVAGSPQGTALVVIMNSKDIDIWNLGAKDQPELIEGGAADTTALAYPGAIEFSPDGKLLATAHTKGKIRLWDVLEGCLFKTIDAYEPVYDVTSVAFCPDGESFAAGATGNDRLRATEVTLWNVETGKRTASFVGNKSGVSQVAISPDGRTMASGGRDSTVRLWDIATQKPLATLKEHRDAVMTIAFSPDGRQIASGSGDRTVRIWKLPAKTGKSQRIDDSSD